MLFILLESKCDFIVFYLHRIAYVIYYCRKSKLKIDVRLSNKNNMKRELKQQVRLYCCFCLLGRSDLTVVPACHISELPISLSSSASFCL